MNTKNQDLAIIEPTIPGLIPKKEMADLVRSFQVTGHEGTFTVDRFPTTEQRDKLIKRRAEINEMLDQKIVSISDGRALAGELVAQLLVSYGRMRSKDDALETAALYVIPLLNMPLFAVQMASADFINRRVTEYDRAAGRTVKVAVDWEPSTIRFAAVAQRHVDALRAEAWKIQGIIEAKYQDRIRPPSQESKDRVAAIVNQATRALTSDNGVRLADEMRRRLEAQHDSAVREDTAERQEYARLGIEPVMIGNRVMTVALARKIKPGLFTAADGRAKDERRQTADKRTRGARR